MVKATFTLKSACQYCLAVLFMTALSLGISAQTTTTFSGAGLPAEVGTTDGGVTEPADLITTSAASVDFGFAAIIGDNATLDQVEINITHTWAADIEATLISPIGTRLELVFDEGGAGDNFTGTIFQDGGASIVGESAPFTGTFEPEGGTFAATFAGENLFGDWTLEVLDDFGLVVFILQNPWFYFAG
ncbi:MAG: proprotein convertase P-domain-containing protein [Bacteroidota bacterium]